MHPEAFTHEEQAPESTDVETVAEETVEGSAAEQEGYQMDVIHAPEGNVEGHKQHVKNLGAVRGWIAAVLGAAAVGGAANAEAGQKYVDRVKPAQSIEATETAPESLKEALQNLKEDFQDEQNGLSDYLIQGVVDRLMIQPPSRNWIVLTPKAAKEMIIKNEVYRKKLEGADEATAKKIRETRAKEFKRMLLD